LKEFHVEYIFSAQFIQDIIYEDIKISTKDIFIEDDTYYMCEV
jgi:hypothetical protein